MKAKLTLPFSFLAVLLTGILAACGGGGGSSGGGGGAIPPAGNPNPGPQASPTLQPSPAGASGTMALGGQAMANAKIVFTCGCSLQAGSTTADSAGNYSLPSSSMAAPATPNPTYTTVPGRNYMVIGATGHTESWTMLFLGSTTAHNLYLSSNNVSDEFTTAASLYVFYNSQNMSDQSFDKWNFNTIAAWTQSLRSSGGNNTAEKTLISDVKSAQQAGNTLFPTVPAWDPDGPGSNGAIRNDIVAVKTSVDPALPTPCPSSGCTSAPSP